MRLVLFVSAVFSVHCQLQITNRELELTAQQLREGAQGADTYEYEIPYDSNVEDFDGISSPDCGPEITLMNVTKMTKPNQIRLSHTGDPTEMSISWTTSSVDQVNVVRYGLLEGDLKYVTYSISHTYQWLSVYTSGYIHEALLVNLMPGKIHYYQIESNNYNTTATKFIAAPEHGSDTPVSFFHIGDAGIFGTSVLVTKNMMENMKDKDYHGLIHCGDISYANKYNGSRPYIEVEGRNISYAKQEVWDTWGQMVEPIGSKVPYMVTPGNHEMDVWDSTNENNTIYSKRFMMPGNERYYAFGVGMVHFVSVSTDESIDTGSTQHTWLDNKLAYLNKNRDKWPWIVTFQHRPIYNSNKNHGNWSGDSSIQGWPDDYESLLLKHNVDLILSGHVHHYERTWPVRNRNHTVKSYQNVKAPVHITCGHAGKDLYRIKWDTDDENTYDPVAPAFSAARDNSNWGHCELQFQDRKTVIHNMYKMGERRATESVEITKSSSVTKHPILSLICISIYISYS